MVLVKSGLSEHINNLTKKSAITTTMIPQSGGLEGVSQARRLECGVWGHPPRVIYRNIREKP